MSLGGTENLFEYIRGYNFKRFEENLFVYDKIKNLTGYYNVTISIYNILDIAEINNWFMTQNCERFPCTNNKIRQYYSCNISYPKYLDSTILPKKYKQMALERITKYDHPNILSVVEWLKNMQDIPENKNEIKSFIKFTNEMDKRKGTNFLKIKPEFEELFEDYS